MRTARLCLVALLALTGCNNFDALVERCVAEGRCGESGAGGGAGGGQATVNATLRLSASSLQFGQVVEHEEAQQTVSITNDGPDTVSSIGAAIVGPDLADFSAVSSCLTVPLAKDSTCNVAVTFKPKSPGQATATLQLQPSGISNVEVPMTGEGVLGLEITPQTVSFPDTNSGSSSSRALTITNRTKALLAPTYVFNPASPFSRTGCDQLSPASSCTLLNVDFAPTDAGYYQSTLTATASAGTNTWSSPGVTVDGYGIRRGALGLAPDPIAGATDAGTIRDFTFTLSNASPTPIGPITVELNPPGAPFSIIDAGCVSLPAGGSCSGVVRFQPPAIGSYNAQLVADAGLGGLALSQLAGHGSGTFPVRVIASPADAGVILRTDAGFSCAGDCTFDVFVVPPAYPDIRLDARGTALHYGLKTWTADCADAGFSDTCIKTINGPLTAGATFERANYAFVTSAVYPGGLGGSAGADSKCMAAAADGGLPGTFVAWLSGASAARSRLPDAGGWIRTDGLPFAKDKASLLAGEVLYPLNRDQRGVELNDIVWTGTRGDGTSASPTEDCLDWSSNTGGLGKQGFSNDGTGTWTSIIGAFNCGSTAHLYCFQVDSRAPASEPSCSGGSFFFVSEVRDPTTVTGPTILDNHCAVAAADAGFPGTYVAWINTDTSAADKLSTTLSGPVYRPDCVLLTPDYAAMRVNRVDFAAAPNVEARRRYVTDPIAVGSGSPVANAGNSSNCQAWSTWSSSSPIMASGTPTSPTAIRYFGSSTNACFYGGGGTPLRTYCVRSQ